jgi:peroxiredoxin
MKRLSFFITAIFVFAAFVSFNNVSAKDGLAVGSALENFKLPDTNGKEQSLNDLKGKNGAILVFLSIQCPVVKGYDERIVKLADEYKAKGINVIGINSNATEAPDKVKTHAAEKYKFPVLIDKNNVLADKFGATVTPEMYYFNAKNVLTYHGAIDNDRSGKNVTTEYLRTALDETLSGKTVTKNTASAFGCTIKRAEKQ